MGTDLQGVCALLDAVGLSRSRFRYVCLSRSHCGYLAVVFVFHFVVPQGPVPPLKSAPLFGLWSVRFPCFPARPGMQCVLQFHFSSTIIHACVRSCTKRRRCHARATQQRTTQPFRASSWRQVAAQTAVPLQVRPCAVSVEPRSKVWRPSVCSTVYKRQGGVATLAPTGIDACNLLGRQQRPAPAV